MTRAAIQARQQTERRFPVRVRIAVPPEGLGRQIEIMHAWLDETCGAEGWGMAPAGLVGVLNDAIAFYFDDAAFAHAFVARFLLWLSGRSGRRRLRPSQRHAAAAARRLGAQDAVRDPHRPGRGS
jgi:hypothetical protein